MMNEFGEWCEEAPAATGATQRIPTVDAPYPIVAQRREIDYTQYIPVAIAGLVAYIALNAFGIVGGNDRAIQLAPPPAPIVINDNSWNWNVCGVCTDGNAAPHFTFEKP